MLLLAVLVPSPARHLLRESDEGIAGQANAVDSHREERASSTSETMQPTALQPTAMEESPTTARSSGAQAPPDAAQELREGYMALARNRGHKRVISPTYVFCKLCTSYAAKRWAALISDKRCTGPTTQTGRLNRLWEGKHPQTGEPL